MILAAFACWIFLLAQIIVCWERRGSEFAHKLRICLAWEFGCRCVICHPPTEVEGD
jgi:hypothetical protein